MQMTTTAPAFQMIPLGQLHESALNPRKTFNAKSMEDLVASVKAKGVITPLLVRPNAKGFEIAAGHRRYRAAKAAGLAELPAVVRAMEDVDFLEVLIMENDEREDLHPLEEAEGYRLLMTRAGYRVERIAARRGCSVKYVYDRVKLLSLIPEAQQLFREDRFTAGHAILLARLSPADQKRIVTVDEESCDVDSVLLKRDATLLTDEQEDQLDKAVERGKGQWPLKAISVRELEEWIARHVRFKAAEADTFLFPEAAAAAQTAAAGSRRERIVEITHDSFIHPEARPDGDRTIRAGYWKRADGKEGSKACDRAVTGVIVLGPDQGNVFRVCVDRERCTVHWAAEIKAKEKRAASGAPKKAAPKREDHEAKWKRERELRDRAQKRCETALPAIFKELAAKLAKVPAGPKGPLGQLLLKHGDGEAAEYLPAPKTAEDLVRFLAFDQLSERPDIWNGLQSFARELKPFGVDVKKYLADVDRQAKAEPAEKTAKAKK